MKRFMDKLKRNEQFLDALAIAVGTVMTLAFLLFAVWWCIG